MIWGAPAAFWLMALVAPLVGLFLYRRRPVLTMVPSIAFWASRHAATRGSPFGGRLRHLATLLMQILILVLLITALAEPQSPGERATGTVLVLDCSATMQTQESEGTRLSQALRVVRDIARDAPTGTSFTLIRAGQYPRTLVANETDPARLEAAIREVETCDLDADLAEAVLMASQIEKERPDRRVYLISDFCGTDVDQLAGDFPGLILKQVGSTQLNMGIVDLRLMPNRHEMAVLIGRNQPTTRPFDLTIICEQGQPLRYSGVTESELTEVTLPAPSRPGEKFRLSLAPADALELDNIAFGVAPAPTEVSVRLVSRGNVFLEQALLARSTAKIELVPPEYWTNRPGADLTILDGPVLEALDRLNGRFVVFSPFSGQLKLADDMPVRSWVADHPILRNVAPDSWGYIRGAPLPVLPSGRSIVMADAAPVVYEWREPSTGSAASRAAGSEPCRAIVFNFDLSASELPFLPAFPVVLWDTIDYLASQTAADDPLAMPTGSVISAMSSSDEPPLVNTPNGRSERMGRIGERFVWQHTEQQGLYSHRDGHSARTVAMNWMSMRSTMPFAPVQPIAVSPERESLLHSSLKHVSWRELLMAVVALIALEWLLFQRRLLRMD